MFYVLLQQNEKQLFKSLKKQFSIA